jgi:hypothetical protein
MRQKSGKLNEPAAKAVKDIRRAMRKRHSSKEKIRIGREGMRGEESKDFLLCPEAIQADHDHESCSATHDSLEQDTPPDWIDIGVGRPGAGDINRRLQSNREFALYHWLMGQL